MTAGTSTTAAALRPSQRRLPPVDRLAVAAMALVIVSGIYLASHLPRRAPLTPAVALVVLAAVLLVVGAALVSRIEPFAWATFRQVGGWALLAYGVIAGLLGYVFVLDGTRGSLLAVLVLSLVVFALSVTLLLAFSVARYQDPATATD